MTSIPILLIEDEDVPARQLTILTRKAAEKLGEESHRQVLVTVEVARNFTDGLARIREGTHPAIIIDLALPDPAGGSSGSEGSRLSGLELVAEATRHNKDAVVAVFTAYKREGAPKLVERHIAALLDKNDTDEVLLPQLTELIRLTGTRFNYDVEPHTEEAIKWAFVGKPPENSAQWTVCLRRFLRAAKDGVAYGFIGRGRSGAGIVASYVDDFLPFVLKLGRYEELEEETLRYERFVSRYIPLRATTSREELAQAGESAILAYSFVGMVHKPRTLARAINEYDADSICAAISAHFRGNCRQWLARDSSAKPYQLAAKFGEHFGINLNRIKDICRVERVAPALGRAASHLQIGPGQMVEGLIRALTVQRHNVNCRPEAINHGDLNVNNLIWDSKNLWMIDFAKTGPGPRILDYAKLEASLKKDVPSALGLESLSDEDRVALTLDLEDQLLRRLECDGSVVSNGLGEALVRRARAIQTIRDCALLQCGSDPEVEYWLGLFMVTAKHVEYLARDSVDGHDVFVPLVTALVSAYRLAGMVESTVVR